MLISDTTTPAPIPLQFPVVCVDDLAVAAVGACWEQVLIPSAVDLAESSRKSLPGLGWVG